MSTSAYQQVLNLVKQLTIEEQLMLLEKLARMRRYQITAEPEHNIMEFKGVGKDVWAGVDVEAYINQERDSWET